MRAAERSCKPGGPAKPACGAGDLSSSSLNRGHGVPQVNLRTPVCPSTPARVHPCIPVCPSTPVHLCSSPLIKGHGVLQVNPHTPVCPCTPMHTRLPMHAMLPAPERHLAQPGGREALGQQQP